MVFVGGDRRSFAAMAGKRLRAGIVLYAGREDIRTSRADWGAGRRSRFTLLEKLKRHA
jgi:hypothetical protein